jgi:uncharacterized protein YndB with AHSA1/START domain
MSIWRDEPPTGGYGAPVDKLRVLTVGRFIQAPAEAAWELISNTASWPQWGPTVSAVEPAGATIELGMRGRVRTPTGIWLAFEITACDPPRSWAWSVLSIPATSHAIAAQDGGCRVSFSVPAPAFAYLPVCRLALTRIAAQLEADGP